MAGDESQFSAEYQFHLEMDHGQFYLGGGLGHLDDEYPLLQQALSAPPHAGDGRTVVVLSPHQSNFHMPVTVQVLLSRPVPDPTMWQQICQDRLEIGEAGTFSIDTTIGTNDVSCPVDPDRYLVEVSGRGFVRYQWQGDEPADTWRIRLWPDDGIPPIPATLWGAGYQFKEPSTPPVVGSLTDGEQAQPKWITTFGSDGTNEIVKVSELERRAAEREREAWGGREPIPQAQTYYGGQQLAHVDRSLLVRLLAANEETARRVAIACMQRAFDIADMSHEPWLQSALSAVTNGQQPPPPFTNSASAFERLAQESAPTANPATQSAGSTQVARAFDWRKPRPRNLHQAAAEAGGPRAALATLFSAQLPDPHEAAVETLAHLAAVERSATTDLYSTVRAML